MTNQPNEHDVAPSGRYEGKFSAKKPKKGKKQHRFPLFVRILFTFFIVLLGLVIAAGATVLIMHEVGRNKMTLNPDTVISFPVDDSSEKAIVQKDERGREIEYNGHTYRLNENLSTFLFMGVDKAITEDSTDYGSAGQADVILLIAIDTETGEANILCFPRDSYAEVDKYSVNGRYIGTENTQLCLAFAYGDQHELSCQNMRTSVERFLYGLQINSYVALDINGILVANDSIGGVTLNALTDFDFGKGRTVKQGEEITLLGKDAEKYIRSRKHDTMDANVARMDRQKQYVQSFTSTVIRQAKGDPLSLVSLYQLLSNYMVTDLGLDKATFLAPLILKNGGAFSFRTIATERIEMVDDYPMYYLDEDDLKDAVITTFYTQID